MNITNAFFIIIALLSGHLGHAENGKFFTFLKDFKTAEMTVPRDVQVYLPPGYDQNTHVSYPVLYMHDGQNLHDPATGFLGQTWNAQNTLNSLIVAKKIRPLIVVGIYNTKDRIDEYTHDRDPIRKQGGQARKYLKFLTRDVKSKIDETFRTLKDRSHTGLMGSSLGGLVSLYAGIIYPNEYGLIGALSPSIWWNSLSIVKLYKTAPVLPQRIYLDSGTVGGERPQDLPILRDSVIHRFPRPQDVLVIVQKGANHSERFWAERLPGALEFLFPAHMP